jgi:sec-independent protein translocase protein TatB
MKISANIMPQLGTLVKQIAQLNFDSARPQEQSRYLALGIAAYDARHYDYRMSFSETVFLFILALVVFGPKKLPEMARKAGKLLAELRRASNEFKSQIETEIAHLEVEEKHKQTSQLPSGPPPGAVASMSLNPASSETARHDPGATLAAPAAEAALPANGNSGNSDGENSPQSLASDSNVVSSATAVADPAGAPATQDSHV